VLSVLFVVIGSDTGYYGVTAVIIVRGGFKSTVFFYVVSLTSVALISVALTSVALTSIKRKGLKEK